MKFVEREFVPLMLGGDINTYSMARAFYEKYRVRSYIFGKYPTGPSYQSRIITYKADEKIDTDEVFLRTVNSFADRYRNKKVLLIGCGDSYVFLISKHLKELRSNIIAPYIDAALMNSLQLKEKFYELCDKHGIDYPATFVYGREMGEDFSFDFPYPVIVKPSDGICYWAHPFDTQHKVYKAGSRAELLRILDDIYDAGYDGRMIIQDMVPGSDEQMRVLTSYSDRRGKVRMMCLGHVLLEEHTPHGLGNHAVIITEPDKGLMSRVKNLLEDLSYTGFSNFDIKYDSRDGKYKFFEINTRQGRSNYYVTGSGQNLAQYLVEDHIYEMDHPLTMAKEEHLWTVVPRRLALSYVKDPAMRAKVKKLIRQGRVVNPVFMKGDLGMPRLARMLKNHFSHYSKFRKYYKR